MIEEKAYVITMSRGDKIQLDSDEMPKVIEAMQAGSPCKLKQGIFNPSFYISIAEDNKRMSDWREEIALARQHNRRDKEYQDGKNQKTKPKLKLLKDIFEGVPLQLADSKKQITD